MKRERLSTNKNRREIVDTHFRPKKVVPFDRWQPARCALRNADDGENTAMVEKVDYSEHASLVYPLGGLATSECLADDVGSL